MMELLSGLILKYPLVGLILSILASLPVMAQIVVAITPSKADDEWLARVESNSITAKILEFLKAFAPWQKGKNGFELSSQSVDKK